MPQIYTISTVYTVAYRPFDGDGESDAVLCAARQKFFTEGGKQRGDVFRIEAGAEVRIRYKIGKGCFHWQKTSGKAVLQKAVRIKNGWYCLFTYNAFGAVISQVTYKKDLRWVETDYFSGTSKPAVILRPGFDGMAILKYDDKTENYNEFELMPCLVPENGIQRSYVNSAAGQPQICAATDAGVFCFCLPEEQKIRLSAMENVLNGGSLKPDWPSEKDADLNFVHIDNARPQAEPVSFPHDTGNEPIKLVPDSNPANMENEPKEKANPVFEERKGQCPPDLSESRKTQPVNMENEPKEKANPVFEERKGQCPPDLSESRKTQPVNMENEPKEKANPVFEERSGLCPQAPLFSNKVSGKDYAANHEIFTTPQSQAQAQAEPASSPHDTENEPIKLVPDSLKRDRTQSALPSHDTENEPIKLVPDLPESRKTQPVNMGNEPKEKANPVFEERSGLCPQAPLFSNKVSGKDYAANHEIFTTPQSQAEPVSFPHDTENEPIKLAPDSNPVNMGSEPKEKANPVFEERKGQCPPDSLKRDRTQSALPTHDTENKPIKLAPDSNPANMGSEAIKLVSNSNLVNMGNEPKEKANPVFEEQSGRCPAIKYAVAAKGISGNVVHSDELKKETPPIEGLTEDRLIPAKRIIVTSKESYLYFGKLLNGLRQGHGRTQAANGNTAYEGGYRGDRRDGFGVYYYKSGKLCYAGGWKQNLRDGMGVAFGAEDGSVFVGNWQKNIPTGRGSAFDMDGNLLYTGDWKNGKRHGYGTEYLDGRILRAGEWRDDKFYSGYQYIKGE